jgi:hypothetical protein
MKKYLDVKVFSTFILITAIGGGLLSNFTELSFLAASLIIGGAILVNGIIIAFLGD